jgi:hypothetical protein
LSLRGFRESKLFIKLQYVPDLIGVPQPLQPSKKTGGKLKFFFKTLKQNLKIKMVCPKAKVAIFLPLQEVIWFKKKGER